MGQNPADMTMTSLDQELLMNQGDPCQQFSGDGGQVPTILPQEETGYDSSRIKQMVSDFKKDVAFYKKMSEVYRLAAVAFKENMEQERKKQEEQEK